MPLGRRVAPRLLLLALLPVARAGDRFAGKTCFITGGTSGLGRAAVLSSAAEGCRVAFTGRRGDRGAAVQAEVEAGGGVALFLQSDVSDSDEVATAAQRALDAFGSLDFAFNNAGVSLDKAHRLHEVPLADWRASFDVNVHGVFHAMRAELAAMLNGTSSSGGSIVNVGSVFSEACLAGSTGYCATKHAVVGLTKAAALQYASDGIRVNTLSPGFSPTEMTSGLVDAEQRGAPVIPHVHPAGRWLQNSEVVNALHWLWSDQSSFYSGQNLILDSGLTSALVPPALWAQKMADVKKANAPPPRADL